MPVRSLNSPVLKWPSCDAVEAAVREWAARVAQERPDLVRLGLFGSYARGDAGFGSDLDMMAVVDSADARPERRRQGWDTTSLPVPVDLLVCSEREWERVRAHGRFGDVLHKEIVWLYERGTAPVR